jgi:hypothetical protein
MPRLGTGSLQIQKEPNQQLKEGIWLYLFIWELEVLSICIMLLVLDCL